MEKRLELLLEEMQSDLSQGHQSKVRKQLFLLNLRKIPRHLAFGFADVARRVNVPQMMLRILSPIVRAPRPLDLPASPAERALYASGLSRLGLYSEAQVLLYEKDLETYPQAKLYQAFNYIFQWNYKEAIPLLMKYLRSESLSPFQRALGLINLSSSQIGDLQYLQAKSSLDKLFSLVCEKDMLPKTQFKLLYANGLELQAQIGFYQKDFDQGLAALNRAEQALKDSASRYELWVKIWRQLLSIAQTDSTDIRELERLMYEAKKSRDWEMVRECDFFCALFSRNDQRFFKVYSGSPFASFRKRIIKLYFDSNPPLFSKNCPWKLGEAPAEIVFDVVELKSSHRNLTTLKPLSLPHRLLLTLCKDFYRPLGLGRLFGELYPSEIYNPESSANRVTQVINELRKWIEENELPLIVECNRREVRLQAKVGFGIELLVPTQHDRIEKIPEWLLLASKSFSGPFSTRELAKLLSVSERTARRMLAEAISKGVALQTRAGSKASYRIKVAGTKR